MTKTEALKHFGSGPGAQRRLAEALGISAPAVSQWPEERIPELRALQIERLLALRSIGLMSSPNDAAVAAAPQ